MSTVEITEGFSLANRCLLYTSFMLAPAQLISGLGDNSPTNLGFLAYNWYTQITWYRAIKANRLHALSLLPVHFNTLYALAYLGGISAGNLPMTILLGVGTAGVMILNTICGWLCWTTNQREGFGVFRFFFFGWRTLDSRWHKFMLLWQIFDTVAAFSCVIMVFVLALRFSRITTEDVKWHWKYTVILPGAAIMLLIGWPLILWSELLMAGNHIKSGTDMIAVWIFAAQLGAMLMPNIPRYLACFRPVFKGLSFNGCPPSLVPYSEPCADSIAGQAVEKADMNCNAKALVQQVDSIKQKLRE